MGLKFKKTKTCGTTFYIAGEYSIERNDETPNGYWGRWILRQGNKVLGRFGVLRDAKKYLENK